MCEAALCTSSGQHCCPCSICMREKIEHVGAMCLKKKKKKHQYSTCPPDWQESLHSWSSWNLSAFFFFLLNQCIVFRSEIFMYICVTTHLDKYSIERSITEALKLHLVAPKWSGSCLIKGDWILKKTSGPNLHSESQRDLALLVSVSNQY